jgi:hypothetical protein
MLYGIKKWIKARKLKLQTLSGLCSLDKTSW